MMNLFEKFVSRCYDLLYSYTHGRVRVYSDPQSSFETTNSARQGCPISPLLFGFFIGKVMEDVIEGLQDVGIELTNVEKLGDLRYADDLVLAQICGT